MSAHLESAARALRAILSARDPDPVWSVAIRRDTRDIGGCPVATEPATSTDGATSGPVGPTTSRPAGPTRRETGAGAHAGKGNEDS